VKPDEYIFIPNIYFPDNAHQPDSLYVGVSPDFLDDFIVSKNDAGEAVSVFSDDTWKFDAYDPRKRKSRMVFDYGIEKSAQSLKIVRETKFIFLCYLWLRPGQPLKVKSAIQLNGLLAPIAKYSAKRNVTVFDVLSSEYHLAAMVSELSPSSTRVMFSFMSVINKIDTNILGFKAVRPSRIKNLSNAVNIYRDSIQQTPPIPFRIYSELISILSNKIDMADQYIDSYLSVLTIHEDETLHGMTPYAQKTKLRGQNIKAFTDTNRYNSAQSRNVPSVFISDFDTLEDLIEKEDLKPFADAFRIRLTPHGIASCLYEIQFLCKITIQLFTGMRGAECKYLPYECLSKYQTFDGGFPIIQGLTTKFGEKRASWVTNKLGEKTVKVAQRIADWVCNSPRVSALNAREEYLFLSPAYTGIGTKFLSRPENGIYQPTGSATNIKSRCSYLHIEIEKGDIKDLESIDPFRDWSSEFKTGYIWPLASHQFRRTLALYASRSGLVKLPSLRRQLQHITNYMTLYYSKGSEFAEDILKVQPDHYINEYRAAQPIAQSMAYLSEILLSDERLFGSFGSLIKTDKEVPGTKYSRKETALKVRRGEIAYKETFLGGCTSTEQCNKKPLRSVIECIGCKSAIIRPSKLESIINSNRALLGSLDKSSTQYIAEKEDLDILIKCHKSIS